MLLPRMPSNIPKGDPLRPIPLPFCNNLKYYNAQRCYGNDKLVTAFLSSRIHVLRNVVFDWFSNSRMRQPCMRTKPLRHSHKNKKYAFDCFELFYGRRIQQQDIIPFLGEEAPNSPWLALL